MEEKRPLKAKNLKIIDHLGTYYATFDGSKMWKIEKWLVKLIMMCDGKKTFDQIAEEVAKLANISTEEAKVGLAPVLEELEKEGFIIYI
ncbi:MAG: PqqD family peptide modification chaperone [Candidatus Aenigmatarchaeota archaeon]